MTTQDLMKLHDQAVSAAIQIALDRKGDRDQPTRQALLDALEAQGREVAELKDLLESSVHGQNQTFDLCKMLEAERDTLRAELAAIRATQEPVAEFAEDFIFNLRKQPNGERWPVGTKLYASPVAKDAGLVAAAKLVIERFEPTKSELIFSKRMALTKLESELSRIGGV